MTSSRPRSRRRLSPRQRDYETRPLVRAQGVALKIAGARIRQLKSARPPRFRNQSTKVDNESSSFATDWASSSTMTSREALRARKQARRRRATGRSRRLLTRSWSRSIRNRGSWRPAGALRAPPEGPLAVLPRRLRRPPRGSGLTAPQPCRAARSGRRLPRPSVPPAAADTGRVHGHWLPPRRLRRRGRCRSPSCRDRRRPGRRASCLQAQTVVGRTPTTRSHHNPPCRAVRQLSHSTGGSVKDLRSETDYVHGEKV